MDIRHKLFCHKCIYIFLLLLYSNLLGLSLSKHFGLFLFKLNLLLFIEIDFYLLLHLTFHCEIIDVPIQQARYLINRLLAKIVYILTDTNRLFEVKSRLDMLLNINQLFVEFVEIVLADLASQLNQICCGSLVMAQQQHMSTFQCNNSINFQ